MKQRNDTNRTPLSSPQRRLHRTGNGRRLTLAAAIVAALAAPLGAANPGAENGIDIRLADLNGDGIDDVLIERDGRWSYHPMGDQRFVAAGQGGIAIRQRPDAEVVGLGDLNADGRDDLLLRGADGAWSYHPMDGRTPIAEQQGAADITDNADWRFAGSADFNGDGADDVLLRHERTGNWYYFPMQGSRHIRAARGMADLPAAKDWHLAGLGDLNGDGRADMLLRHDETGNWYYIPMDGRETIREQRGPAELPSRSVWSFAGIGDFDGDGKDDVLLRHRNGRWQQYIMDGRESLAGEPVRNLPLGSGWRLGGVGDLNGDGRDDVLLRHDSGRWHSSAAIGLDHLPGARPNRQAETAEADDWRQNIFICNKVFLTLPGNPVVDQLADEYGVIEMDSDATTYENLVTIRSEAEVPVSWRKPSGPTGFEVIYLLNDAKFWEGDPSDYGGNFQYGSDTLRISKSGRYDLQVALCTWYGKNFLNPSSCCGYSDVQSFTVADTDGAHTEPLELNERPGNTPFTNSTDSVVAAYFVEWGGYGGRDFRVDKIPAYNLTHVLYGFIPICGGDTINDSLKMIEGSFEALQKSCEGRDDFKVAIHDPWAAVQWPAKQSGHVWATKYKGHFGQFMQLKQAYPEIKILPSIGGWTLSDPFYYFGDVAKRTTFVDSVKEFLLTWKFFDGVDIDWEFPGGGAANPDLGDAAVDGTTYKLLMKELRAMLDQLELDTGRSLELTTAIAAGDDKIGRVDYNTTQQYLDYIFVMTYDFYGAWSTTVLGHQAGLYAPSWDPTATYNAHGGIQALRTQGVAASKLVLGVAMYGRGWAGVSNWTGVHHLTGTATGPITPGTWETGVLDYQDIASKLASGGWTKYWDATAQAPYLWGNVVTAVGTSTTMTSGDLISYDDAQSVQAKGAYARSNGLAGLFAWEIDADNGDILNAMHRGLGHGTGRTNRAPVARAGSNQNAAIGNTVTLDGSMSYDLDGDTLTHSWSQSQGATVTLSNASSTMPTFTAPDVSVATHLTFNLTVSDGALSDSDSVNIVVAPNAPPVADAGPDQSFQTPASIQLVGSATDEDGDDITYSWSQTSGTTVALTAACTTNATFDAPAVTASSTMVFTLTATDTKNATGTDQVSINLQPGSTATCRTTDANASNYDAWDSTKANYVACDRVANNNKVWEAKYWTNNEPAITATTWPADWTLVSTGLEIPWNPQAVYLKGDEVNYKTRRYRAGWWTKGQEPPHKSGVWTDIGANTCP